MNGQKAFRYVLAASVLAAITGATQAQAASCSASVAAIISRSSGGTCDAALSLNEEFTITYRIDNNSIVDDAGEPNDGEPVGATIDAANTMDATLAQETANVGGTELPTVLEFVPVCPAGSVANEGDECAVNADCGGSACGCVDSIPGMTCNANGGNHV